MSTVTVKFTEAVANILRRSEITASSLKLPGQLRREDYMAVNKVIEAAGGKWNRKAGAHLFERDPRAIFADALGAADTAGSIKAAPCAIVDAKKTRQAFYTPAPVVSEMLEIVRHFCLSTPIRVLEPSAGDGRLARAAVETWGSKVDICEIDPDERAKAAEWGTVIGEDFLKVEPTREYDLVLMNPPFASGQDEAHIAHARQFLRNGGLLVAVCTPMTGRRATAKSRKFNEELGMYASRLKLTSGSFKASGTGVETELFVLRV